MWTGAVPEPETLYYHVAYLAGLLLDEEGKPWRTERMRRWLQRKGATKKVNGRWVVTPDGLRSAFPEMWWKLQSEMDDGL